MSAASVSQKAYLSGCWRASVDRMTRNISLGQGMSGPETNCA